MVLGDFKIRFVNEIKYLGVFLNSKLCDDEDINRQVRYLYGTANRLKTCFYKCSTHSRTSPKNFGGAMKFCPNFVTFAQIMILEYISDMTKKLSEILRRKTNFVLKSW